jgi:hypothetical protein
VHQQPRKPYLAQLARKGKHTHATGGILIGYISGCWLFWLLMQDVFCGLGSSSSSIGHSERFLEFFSLRKRPLLFAVSGWRLSGYGISFL